jgi:hypothetical protein
MSTGKARRGRLGMTNGGKMGMAKKGVGIVILGATAALVLSACGGSSSSSSGGGDAQKGGTIYYLTNAEQFDQIDPQRIYTGEDLAFFVVRRGANASPNPQGPQT